jgi:alditol oxidase
VASATRNWAGNQAFGAQHFHQPETIEDVRRIVMERECVKAVGSRHSFSAIADTTGDMISLERFNRVFHIDEARKTVKVGAGIPYGTFCAELHNAGYAVHNMASLPQITVGGACATATHGSGDSNGNLATAVAALTLVTADGDVVEVTRDDHPNEFPGLVVGLGGFGIVTDLTLDIRPTYSVRQDIYEHLPVSELATHFDEIMALGYSVSLFTDWQSDTVNQLWIKRVLEETAPSTVESKIYGARLAETLRHPLPDKPVESCTDQMGQSGPWHERLPHFRMDGLGTSGDELQAEYFVSRESAPEALTVVANLRDLLRPVIRISEVRTVAADNLWMSPSYQTACVGIHFTWKSDWPAVAAVLPLLEVALAPFEPRPHWGKLFTLSPQTVAGRYPRFDDFRNLMHQYDPDGRFRNAFLDEYMMGGANAP